MSDQTLKQLARWLLVSALLLASTGLLLVYFGWEAGYAGWGFRGFASILSLPFALTGIFILNRLPRHGIGWVFLALGFVSSIQGLLFEYMLFSLVLYPNLIPGGLQVAWFLEWFWVVFIYLVALILILFPSGAPPSPRWKRYLWFVTAIMTVFAVIMALMPGPMDSSFGSLENPYGLEALHLQDAVIAVSQGLVMLFTFGLPLVSLVNRFRRAVGIERQQYKWFVFAAALILLISIFTGISENSLILQLLFMISILLVPLAVTVAVLRYRLFDIDLIIRRTLQYSLLTGMLALVYFGSVVILQSLVENLTGEQSPLVIVISTLAIAALFNPLRMRVQAFIDRRFYRKKYDAQQALAQFAATARDEVDVDQLTAALLNVVEETVHPEQVNLWINMK